jgi:hypothetical protein
MHNDFKSHLIFRWTQNRHLELLHIINSTIPLARSQNQIFKLRKPRFHTCTHKVVGLFQASAS